MKLKKKEDHSVGSFLGFNSIPLVYLSVTVPAPSILLRRGNKIPMEGVTEAKYRSETKGMTSQENAPPGDPPHK